ncbi:MAG: exodeoxyribonuclease VII large subunit [Oscillospiraceae bacterium]|nr:exodeoxyribonuclease VII large subunit [Oscillospiraceae bacterium]
MSDRIYDVSELNAYIKQLLDSDPALAGIYVRGELSNYKVYSSGHHYFTIKDKDAAISCVMFRRDASSLRFRPEDGMKVVAFGRVTVYPRDGKYQLYCSGLTPVGVGDLYVAFEQLKTKLNAEGLFDRSLKKPIPKYPARIALITSGSGAAVHDMIRILGKRFPLSKVIVMPVRVQGVEAPPEIVGAIRYANVHKVADLIITGRGGGSIEDLWAFNDERVARAVFASEIPVISAVGHEPDVTICDYVADVRAATPSNGAELAVPDRAEIMTSLASDTVRMRKAMHRLTEKNAARLDRIKNTGAFKDPMSIVRDRRVALDGLTTAAAASCRALLSDKRASFLKMAASLDALSPLKTLARGYGVVTDETGRTITSSSDVEIGDRLSVRLSKGSLDCTVSDRKDA